MLVAAVLGPEQGENRELEMVRVSAEQLSDSLRFLVGQTEGAVQGLMSGQLRQMIECNERRGGISHHQEAFRYH